MIIVVFQMFPEKEELLRNMMGLMVSREVNKLFPGLQRIVDMKSNPS